MQTNETIATRVKDAPTAEINITKLSLSKSNPSDRGDLAELAADIQKHGVLQPIIVREHPTVAGTYEVIAGHRRTLAASAAGLATVPARVLDLDDVELVEVRAVENLHRADLSPLEEADTYRALVEIAGSVPEVAARVGKSTTHVFQRLALLGLPDKARKLLADGELDVVVALAVARIPDPKLRDSAAAAVAKVGSEYSHAAGGQVAQRMSTTEALAFIRKNYMLRLVDAQFDRADAELVPGAGACGPCPKRTGGNGAGLFGDILSTKDGAELCTDPTCFDAKTAAAWLVKAEKWKAAGHEVLDAKASARVFKEYRDEPDEKSGYVDVDDEPNYYTDATWRKVLGKHLPESLTVARDREGKVRWLAKESTLVSTAKKAGVTIPGADGMSSRGHNREAPSSAEKAKQRRKLYRRKLIAAARGSMLEAMAQYGAGGPRRIDVVLRHAIAELEEHAHGKTLQEGGRYHPGELVAERRGLAKKFSLAKLADELKGADLVGLIAELLAARRFLEGWEHEWGDDLEKLAKGIDVPLAELEAKAEPSLPDRVKRLIMTPAQKAAAKAAIAKKSNSATDSKPAEKPAKAKKAGKS